MSAASWYPKITCYAERCGDSMIYFAPHEQIKINGNVSVQQSILHHCTGFNSAEAIAGLLATTYDGPRVPAFLALLREQGIVVDSRNCWRGYHVYSSNPMPFFSPPPDEQLIELYRAQPFRGMVDCGGSSLLQLLRRRSSSRKFAQTPITADAILQVARAGYGVMDQVQVLGVPIGRRTVPSAGALYPLCLHVVVRQAATRDDCGVYVFDDVRLRKANGHFDDSLWQQCFLEDVYVQTHSACFVISGDIERETKKYADRGYRYTILEAGHVAQNMLLSCVELENVGAVEVGGFFDEGIANFLALPSTLVPLTTVMIGSLA